jgi:hypothetical protein
MGWRDAMKEARKVTAKKRDHAHGKAVIKTMQKEGVEMPAILLKDGGDVHLENIHSVGFDGGLLTAINTNVKATGCSAARGKPRKRTK